MIDAAKLASAKRITAVLPLYPYSRQDKKSRPREPITAKLVAEMIQSAGADRVLTMDLHAGQVQGFFEVPVDHMTALPMLAQYFRDLGLPEELVAVAPDTGRTRLASKFAEMIGGDLAVLQKDRPAHNVARVTNVIGDIDGKCAVMTDDMVDTAGTLVAGAEFLKDRGAKKVYACATHGIFSDPADRAHRGKRPRQRHRHRHGADRPADEAGARDRPDRGRHPRRDDPQRLRRRLGVRHLPGHERPLLTRGYRIGRVVRTPSCDAVPESASSASCTWASGSPSPPATTTSSTSTAGGRALGDLRRLPLAADPAGDQPPRKEVATIRRRHGGRTSQAAGLRARAARLTRGPAPAQGRLHPRRALRQGQGLLRHRRAGARPPPGADRPGRAARDPRRRRRRQEHDARLDSQGLPAGSDPRPHLAHRPPGSAARPADPGERDRPARRRARRA